MAKNQLQLFPQWEQEIEDASDFGTAHNRVYVSFSGGKDSVACYLETIKQYPKHIVRLVFADTGDETDETYDYVRWFDAHVHPVIRLTSRVVRKTSERRRELETVRISWNDPNDIVRQSTNDYISVFDEIRFRHEGDKSVAPFPTNGIRFCTATLKVRCFDRFVRNDCIDRSLTLVVIGLRQAESSNRANTPKFAQDTDNHWDVWYPIYKYTLDDVWEAHKVAGIPKNPTYEYRERSNCIGCPFAGIHEVKNTIARHGVKSVQGWIDLEMETGFSWRNGVSMNNIANGVTVIDTKEDELLSCASGFCDI